MALLLSACPAPAPEAEPEPVPIRVHALERPVGRSASLSLDTQGRVWIGERGRVRLLSEATGESRGEVETGGVAVPRLLGTAAGRAQFRLGVRSLATVDPEAMELRAFREEVEGEHLAADPRGRHLYLAAPAGAVLGLHPRTLAPDWAWPRRGAPATALAASPEGDRMYQALGPVEDAGARLLVRDVQTGRILLEAGLPAPLEALAAAEGGVLYGLEEDGGVLAFRAGRDLHPLWRQPAHRLGLSPPLELRAPSGGARVLVISPSAGEARMLDGTDGALAGRYTGGVRDGAFGPSGALYLLFERDLRVFP